MKTALLAAEKLGLEVETDLLKDPTTRPDRLLTDLSQVASVVGYLQAAMSEQRVCASVRRHQELALLPVQVCVLRIRADTSVAADSRGRR